MTDERGSVLREAVEFLVPKLGATVLVIVSDQEAFIEEALNGASVPVVLATGRKSLRQTFGKRTRKTLVLHEGVGGSLPVLHQVKDLLLGAFLDGTIRRTDRALILVTNLEALDGVLFFDVERDTELTHLRDEVKGRLPMRVVERVLRLASELAHEGREGKPVSTVFVLGDTKLVMEASRQVVINPFQGHPESERNLLHDSVWETVKEFALIDGAFVIRDDGVIEAAGRYIEVDEMVELESGLGGRHLAGASITRTTKAIAVVVSASGAIRVFKDGRVIFVVGRL